MKTAFEIVKDHLEDANVCWTQGEHTLDNLTHKYELWTSNGKAYLKIYNPTKLDFNENEQKELWPLIEAVRQRAFTDHIKKMEAK